MTRQFLSIGECMIEMAPRADGSYSMGFAGDTFNTAWYARRVAGPDLEIGYLSAVGDDGPSQEMTTFMREAGVRPELAVRPGRAVGLYMISLIEGERSFSYWRSTSAATTLADDLDRLPGLGAGDMAFFSGITLAILPESGREKLLAALAKARAEGVTVAFDPNLRPRLWSGTEDMCRWIMRGAEVADIALPSYEDEGAHFGDADKAATGARYLSAGAQLVIVKDGPLPVLLVTPEAENLVETVPAEQVVDTTAAGDSFNARFLVGVLSGETATVAAAQACGLSRQVIGAHGALVESASAPITG
ncbi:2-keto-3-deoxygluconate kinase [Poseidonocella pacifica]|uniref:2-keto-3-deoxygluconate kinase n=1 Tax=Poseidonocella pacifica TaxID=871651 RepID=A0A1I0XIZ0_9RHOB|nr:sugar kinase [Poseidonocella pacifica]SFB00972.1 2-keto-3-deoxygluconate kinase [Poseidonocella pacifica]